MTRRDEPHLIAEGDALSLHFDAAQVQSRMLRSAPDTLVLPYTRVMMGFLLFVPAPVRLAMIGLGGGSLARYCRHTLPDADFTAIECSPEVIALRDALAVPPDGPHFRVVCADGADWVEAPPERVDVLLVDGFDAGGQPARLCSRAFYRACHAALRDGGVLVVNLNRAHTRYGQIGRIRKAFGDRTVRIDTDDGANTIVFAGRGGRDDPFPPRPDVLDARLRTLAPTHDLGLAASVAALLRDAPRRRR
jgi:spermidine synthase